ncbi:hypothetical protein XA68_11454 [Ophiocordyceps unilateralis]|uniref:Methyltransferase domain-containing protein n=1 Tax=Ophiocordyceps unilateralis TaxID=268505 RepID=A0A2A9NXY7_OPHUN|nr:hypothetical protein XA68_11454 [Ophiocordyceps unilateralis]
MRHHCILFSVFSLAVILFATALFRQMGHKATLWLRDKPSSNGLWSNTQPRLIFEQVALKYGTDKVTSHGYQSMYEKYLPTIRDMPVKMLEIGLGCNMDYGPGASYYTWLEYFPMVDLYFIELDASCVLKFQDKMANAHVFVGDQADIAFLDQFAAITTADGLFDIVIDDGGHTMKQQITSLERLWPIVKPGGLYVIEDLQTSYLPDYGGDSSKRNMTKLTTMNYLLEIFGLYGRDLYFEEEREQD